MTPQAVEVLAQNGPMTGTELAQHTGMQALPLWRQCMSSPDIYLQQVGQRYVRLDRAVSGWARLSPSIRREFLTYTVLGAGDQHDAVARRAQELTSSAKQISRLKTYVAKSAMTDVLTDLQLRKVAEREGKLTFIIAGDITYDMAHDVPRPESSTGLMVVGSDLDIIVVAADDLPDQVLADLDAAIHRKKHYLLRQPQYREEVDYIIKRISTIAEQLDFDSFEHAVAAKILHEGKHLCGSKALFEQVKQLVADRGIDTRLAQLHEQAVVERSQAEQFLLSSNDDERSGVHFNLFYTREEREEITSPEEMAAIIPSDR